MNIKIIQFLLICCSTAGYIYCAEPAGTVPAAGPKICGNQALVSILEHRGIKLTEIVHSINPQERRPIVVVHGSDASCMGLPGIIVMLIDPFFVSRLGSQELEFTVRHEITHGTRSHSMWQLITLIVSLGATAVLPSCYTVLPNWYKVISLALVGITFVALRRSHEKEADKIAIQSMKTAAGAISLFDSAQENNKALRSLGLKSNSWLTRFWSYLTYTRDGESRFDILHPSIAERKKMAEIVSKQNS